MTQRAGQSPDPTVEGAFALPPDALRALAQRMVDDYCDGLAGLADEPAWRPVPAEVRARLAGPLPRAGRGLAEAYGAFRRDVLPYRYGNVHPRFWGWVNGSGLPVGVLADFLASSMNSNVGAFDQSAVYVEEQVLGWMRELFTFPEGSDGVRHRLDDNVDSATITMTLRKSAIGTWKTPSRRSSTNGIVRDPRKEKSSCETSPPSSSSSIVRW